MGTVQMGNRSRVGPPARTVSLDISAQVKGEQPLTNVFRGEGVPESVQYYRWASSNTIVIAHKTNKTQVHSLSIQLSYFVLVLTVPRAPCDVRVRLVATNQHQKITHNEIQVTGYQTCSVRAIRTIRGLTDIIAYDSQEHIRRGYQSVGLHLPRLRGHEHAITSELDNLGLPITVPLSVTFRPKLWARSLGYRSTDLSWAHLLDISCDR